MKNKISHSVPVAVPESGEGSKGSQTLILSKIVKEARQLGCSTFEGTSDAIVAKQWLKKVVATFDDMSLVDELKLEVAIRLLDKGGSVWWENLRSRAHTQLTWTDFLEFDKEYYTYFHRNQKRQEFMTFTQGSRSVMEYETELKDLAAFVPKLVGTEEMWGSKFEGGLNLSIREKMSITGAQINIYPITVKISYGY